MRTLAEVEGRIGDSIGKTFEAQAILRSLLAIGGAQETFEPLVHTDLMNLLRTAEQLLETVGDELSHCHPLPMKIDIGARATRPD